MRFTSNLNKIISGSAVALTALSQAGGFVPPEIVPKLAIVISLAQGIFSLWAHQRNPNGDPARLPYSPEVK